MDGEWANNNVKLSRRRCDCVGKSGLFIHRLNWIRSSSFQLVRTHLNLCRKSRLHELQVEVRAHRALCQFTSPTLFTLPDSSRKILLVNLFTLLEPNIWFACLRIVTLLNEYKQAKFASANKMEMLVGTINGDIFIQRPTQTTTQIKKYTARSNGRNGRKS